MPSVAVAAAAAFGLVAATASAPKVRNVLYIVFDDLRPELGAYGAHWMQTPSLDSLAANATLFTHAYCRWRSDWDSRAEGGD